tara:strand:- start:2768 stop:4735 length:1968 start_codon:yes stop_codon:yes gene_type:complete
MAYQIPVKYFNSFWLKKVVGDTNLDPQEENPSTWNYESTVTTTVLGGGVGITTVAEPSPLEYVLPTWPGLPWSRFLSKPSESNPNVIRSYPCFPWGGRNWAAYQAGNNLPVCGGSLINKTPTEEEGRERNWFVEEARIRGGYNNTTVDFGVKAYLVEDENLQQNRFNAIIYSGVYNSRTGINNTNVFSTAEPITKALDPSNGSIQKLYAYDTNLTIFQENKVSRALIDKDAIYSAEGEGTPVSSLKVVIGQVEPYKGEYGISKNPESWAQYGFRQYFSDRYRSAVLRLSMDGITEISTYGMTDWFRDNLELVSDDPVSYSVTYIVNTSGKFDATGYQNLIRVQDLDCPCETKIPIGSLMEINGITRNGLYVSSVVSKGNGLCEVYLSIPWRPGDFALNDFPTEVSFITVLNNQIQGGFDTHNKSYVISLQTNEPNTGKGGCSMNVDAYTLSFDESINGWVSFYSYIPDVIDSLKNNYISIVGSNIYKHYLNTNNGLNYGNFYGEHYESSIEFVFNVQPSMVKNFQTVGYEGTNGWEVDYFISDATEQLLQGNQYFSARDMTNAVYSLDEGLYIDPVTQMPEHAGFYIKENKYVSNIINSGQDIQPGQINFGDVGSSMSGIKGFFATVRVSTDSTTQKGGMKELYSVSSKWVISSN